MRPLAFCNVVVYITHSEIMTGWPNKNSTSGSATPTRINLNEEVNVIMPSTERKGTKFYHKKNFYRQCYLNIQGLRF